VAEGGDAVFTLTTSPAPSSNLDVSVTIATVGDYGVTAGSRTVTIPTSGSVTFTVATTDDAVDEPDGTVTVTLVAGSGYSGSGSVTVAVSDNDDPSPIGQKQPVVPVGTTLPDPATLTACQNNPELLISSPTASRSDTSVDFTVMLSCIPDRNPIIIMTPFRDGVVGATLFISLSKTQLTTTITLNIGTETELGLALAWSSGIANRHTQQNVTFTD